MSPSIHHATSQRCLKILAHRGGDVNDFEQCCAGGTITGNGLNVRAAEEEVGGDVEKVAEADELLIVALKRPFLVALIDWLGDTEVSRDLRLRHPAGDAALLHSASDQSFQGHLDKIIRIMYYCNGDYTFYVYE